MSIGKRYIMDCKTGKLSIEDGDAAWVAEREQAKLDAPAEDATFKAERERQQKIGAEVLRIAEQSLIDKGEIEARG